MLIGYARVSTADQTIDLQIDALEDAGCSKIFTDIISGSKIARPGLDDALAYLREGDTLVVWKLDRLGRSLKHLIEIITHLNEEGKEFKSLQESLDTATPTGKLIFHVLGALAEFERSLIRERTKAGLAAARARGRIGGRPRVLNKRNVALVKSMLADPSGTVKEVAETLGVSRATIYNYLKQENKPTPKELT
ncbi:MAG: recombinase family protein [Candidatus Marinimicrobia bacterium]|nr:recombinase family protein [Candidatus Neomarinimicrobiota bacterium]